MVYLTIFVLGFAKVAARAFQQKNVMHDQFAAVVPISYVMAFMEIGFIGISAMSVIENGYLSIIPAAIAYGTGGWMGTWSAIWLHKRLKK